MQALPPKIWMEPDAADVDGAVTCRRRGRCRDLDMLAQSPSMLGISIKKAKALDLVLERTVGQRVVARRESGDDATIRVVTDQHEAVVAVRPTQDWIEYGNERMPRVGVGPIDLHKLLKACERHVQSPPTQFGISLEKNPRQYL